MMMVIDDDDNDDGDDADDDVDDEATVPAFTYPKVMFLLWDLPVMTYHHGLPSNGKFWTRDRGLSARLQ